MFLKCGLWNVICVSHTAGPFNLFDRKLVAFSTTFEEMLIPRNLLTIVFRALCEANSV